MEIDKQQHRLEIAKRVRRIPKTERESLDRSICELIVGSEFYVSCSQVLMYVPLPGEVGIGPVHERAERDGKKVFVPVSDEREAEWSFRRWRLGAELRRGRGNVWEPEAKEQPDDAASLCLVPGRAFTRRGQRLGRGRGWYDRLMPRLQGLGATVGVAYECQVMRDLPTEAFDQAVQYLVTETGFARCAGSVSAGA